MTRPLSSLAFFHLRRRSLLRGNLLVIASFFATIFISGFPNTHPTLLLLFPAVLAMYGTSDTVRSMQNRWSFYHGGVMLLLFMDMMAICLILFFLVFPYMESGVQLHPGAFILTP